MNTLTSLHTTGTTNRMHEEIHDLQLPDVMMGIKRLLAGGTMAALDFYPSRIGYLEDQLKTVYGLQAALFINRIDADVVKAALAESANHPADVKPADLYHKYSYALRRIASRHTQNSGNALHALQSLSLEQTRPFGELESQPWIDGYTGETETVDEALEVGKACDKFLAQPITASDPKGEMALTAHQLAVKEYADTMVRKQLLAKNKAEISLCLKIAQAAGELDETKALIPVPVTNGAEWYQEGIVAEHQSAQVGFDAEVDEISDDEEEHGKNVDSLVYEKETSLHDHEPSTFLKTTDYISDADLELSVQIRKANARIRLIRKAVNKLVDRNPMMDGEKEFKKRIKRVMPGVAKHFIHVVIRFLDEDLVEEMASQLLQGNEIPLSEAIEGYEPQIAHAEPIGEGDQDRVDPEFLNDLAKTFDQDQQNPINTPDWNVAKIAATMAGATLDDANTMAWQAWKSRKATIKAIAQDKSGLILDSGRKVSWTVAQLKLTNNELEISADVKARLLKKLAELHVNNSFTKTLAK